VTPDGLLSDCRLPACSGSVAITCSDDLVNQSLTDPRHLSFIGKPRPSAARQITTKIDGDTVRSSSAVYRLVGFDESERGDKARCEDERRRAETATPRLSGDARLIRVACS